ncbi:lachesin-like isoform X2 [Sitodiplosis mosellana]|uniref:lachesin-like isoform X2 n=1 Tax=Sitodiplosis mosellana TaxID=263140 RepID=UPI002443C840|nr:lachesin-like isoform X2 [Sitodiplosis mosellana]
MKYLQSFNQLLLIKMFLQFFVGFSLVKFAISFQPEFAEPIVNISVAVGRDATFTCHVRHLGGYRVGWVKADTKAIQAIHEHVITHNPRVSVSHSDLNTWNLHIKSVTEDDRGGYMCQLNTDPMKSQIGYLDVVIPPDFIAEDTSSDVIVPEGSSVKLTCRARGYPHPNVTWRREDNGEITLKDGGGTKQLITSFSGEVLKLTKLSRSEMGSYLCIASNGVPPSVSKRISLSIHFHPVINVRNQLVGSPFEKDVTIECNVEASPKSINYWIKDVKDGLVSTGEMIVSSAKYNVQETSLSLYETRMTLTIRRFQKDDIGSYRCIAKNSLGEVDSSIRLYEIPDAKGSHNHNHYNHGHTSKHNPNEVYKSHKQQQQQQQSQSYSNQRTPKVTHPALVSDDDETIFGSAEDYDDSDLSPNIFLRPTKTSSDGFGANNNHHYPYQSSHGNNNNARFNIPLFGGSGSNGAASNVGTGINGNALNANNAIVTRTEVRSTDNEVSSATASPIIAPFAGKHSISNIYSMLFDYNFILFAINLLISVFTPLLAT